MDLSDNVKIHVGDTNRNGERIQSRRVATTNGQAPKPYVQCRLNGKKFQFEANAKHEMPLFVARFLAGLGYIDKASLDAIVDPKKAKAAKKKTAKKAAPPTEAELRAKAIESGFAADAVAKATVVELEEMLA